MAKDACTGGLQGSHLGVGPRALPDDQRRAVEEIEENREMTHRGPHPNA
jgi:hypothetical protein